MLLACKKTSEEVGHHCLFARLLRQSHCTAICQVCAVEIMLAGKNECGYPVHFEELRVETTRPFNLRFSLDIVCVPGKSQRQPKEVGCGLIVPGPRMNSVG